MADGRLAPLAPENQDELNQHLIDFERWFVQQQLSHGLEGSPITTYERAAILAYIAWRRVTYEEQHGR